MGKESLLRQGRARGPAAEEGGEDSPRGHSGECVRRWVGRQGRVGVGGFREWSVLRMCTHVLCSNQPGLETGKGSREVVVVWSGLVWWGVGRVQVQLCVHLGTASKCWCSGLCCVGCPWVPSEPPPGALTHSPGLLSTLGCPGKLPTELCLVAWPAGRMPTAGPRQGDPASASCQGSPVSQGGTS